MSWNWPNPPPSPRCRSVAHWSLRPWACPPQMPDACRACSTRRCPAWGHLEYPEGAGSEHGPKESIRRVSRGWALGRAAARRARVTTVGARGTSTCCARGGRRPSTCSSAAGPAPGGDACHIRQESLSPRRRRNRALCVPAVGSSAVTVEPPSAAVAGRAAAAACGAGGHGGWPA